MDKEGKFVTLLGILTEIEELRQNMIHVARTKGTTADQEVLAASRKLDVALNTYYLLQKGHICDGV